MNKEKATPKVTPKIQGLKHPNEELWKEVKVAAIMAGKTMTEWVEEVLRKHLAPTKKSETKGGTKA